jgi:hypothetical protein
LWLEHPSENFPLDSIFNDTFSAAMVDDLQLVVSGKSIHFGSDTSSISIPRQNPCISVLSANPKTPLNHHNRVYSNKATTRI